MRTTEDKLNEATAMLDDAINIIHAQQRLLTRAIEDYTVLTERMVDFVYEYDRMMAVWEDEVEGADEDRQA